MCFFSLDAHGLNSQITIMPLSKKCCWQTKPQIFKHTLPPKDNTTILVSSSSGCQDTPWEMVGSKRSGFPNSKKTIYHEQSSCFGRCCWDKCLCLKSFASGNWHSKTTASTLLGVGPELYDMLLVAMRHNLLNELPRAEAAQKYSKMLFTRTLPRVSLSRIATAISTEYALLDPGNTM